MTKDIIIGFVSGIITNLIGMFLYMTYLKVSKGYPYQYTLDIAFENNTFGNIVALGALPSLGLFFFYLQKDKVYMARGVVIATMLAAIFVFISKI
ncbi:MAG TPA: hypothetical protein VKZ42_02680 [Flavobacteriaceae bacterium]|nr:hypothetical protein [Flavobacteriaceae bacterium]